MATKSKKRQFKRTQEKVHDLYKLTVADALVNQAWDGTKEYRPTEHVHYYHSIDSKGVPQNTSISVCGHFHVLEVVEAATDDSPAVLKCSPPMKWVRGRNSRTGQMEKKLALANPDDTHVHDVQYIDSHKFTPAKINPEFVKFQSQEASKVPTVSGVVEGQ